jgi:hypothetical protein
MADDFLEFTEHLTESSITDKLKGYNDKWDKKAESLYPKLTNYYRFYRDQEYSLNGTPVKVPVVFTTIEIETPHLLNNIFAQSDVIECEAKFNDPGDSQKYRVQSYINNLIINVDKGRKKTLDFIKNYLIFGFAVSKAYWNTSPDKDIDINSKMAVDVNSAHPDFYNVDPFSFAFDTEKETSNIQELDWVRERIFLSKNAMRELRDNGKCGNFMDNDLSSTEDKGKKTRNPNEDADKGTYYDEFYVRLYDKKKILDDLGEETGEHKVESKQYRIWLLANNKIIKFQENIFGLKPYVTASPYPIPFSIIGMGEPEVIGGIANRYSLNNYQAGLLASKIGKSPYLVGPNSGLMPYNLSLLEEGVLFSKDINDVKPLPSMDPQNLHAIIEFGQYLQDEVESTTGVTKFLQGTDIGNMTATQASLISQNSTNRLAIKLEQLQENYIVPLAEMMFLLNKQNMQAPVTFRDTNNNILNLQKQDFFGNYTWMSTSPVTISNKALDLQNNMSLIEMLEKASEASKNTPEPSYVSYGLALQTLIQPNVHVPDILKFFKPFPPPPPPMPGPSGPGGSGPGGSGPMPASPNGGVNAGGPSPLAPGPSPQQVGPNTPFNAGPPPQASVQPMGMPPETPHPGFHGNPKGPHGGNR